MPDLPWLVYAMLLAPLGLILLAAAYKGLQVRAASEWPSTPGRVVISNSEVREVRVMDNEREDGFRLEPRNFANIVYEYSVSGEVLRNNRVSIGEDRGDFGVAETIARYPVGTIVTVYYNSRHPRDAVLERDTPRGWWGCLGIGTAIALAIIFGSVFGLNQLTEFIATRLGNPEDVGAGGVPRAPSDRSWRCSRLPCGGRLRWRRNGRWCRAPSRCRMSSNTGQRRPRAVSRAAR